MGSTRLPGKSLRPLAGRTILGLLLERLRGCRELDAVVVATSTRSIDDSIANLAESHGVPCVRGSEEDVLARFNQALSEMPAESVVRICADNPLTDPEQVDALVRFFHGRACDYAYNNRPECGLPSGLGAEIVSAGVLRRLHERVTMAVDREHVTLAILRQPNLFKIETLTAPPALSYPELRLDVDCEEDLTRLDCICRLLRPGAEPHWATSELIDLLRARPELLGTRRHDVPSNIPEGTDDPLYAKRIKMIKCPSDVTGRTHESVRHG